MAFFKELENNVKQAIENYDNFIVMGDFNIDIRQTTSESHKLDEFFNFFSLTNVIKSDTYFTKFCSSTMDLFLTNKKISFKKQTVSKLALATIAKATEAIKNLMKLIF